MEGETVLMLARKAIETYVKTGSKINIPARYPKEMDQNRGVFVTIYIEPKELRGCIGFPYPQVPLIEGLIDASIAVCNDPRFPPLSKNELECIWIEVSVLTAPELVDSKSIEELLESIVPGRDGLIIKKGSHSALYLPQVWDEIPSKEGFLSSLSMKAGMSPDEWKIPSAKFYRFQVEAFAERRTINS